MDVDRDDQADTQTQQPANVDPISVEGGKRTPVADQTYL